MCGICECNTVSLTWRLVFLASIFWKNIFFKENNNTLTHFIRSCDESNKQAAFDVLFSGIVWTHSTFQVKCHQGHLSVTFSLLATCSTSSSKMPTFTCTTEVRSLEVIQQSSPIRLICTALQQKIRQDRSHQNVHGSALSSAWREDDASIQRNVIVIRKKNARSICQKACHYFMWKHLKNFSDSQPTCTFFWPPAVPNVCLPEGNFLLPAKGWVRLSSTGE